MAHSLMTYEEALQLIEIDETLSELESDVEEGNDDDGQLLTRQELRSMVADTVETRIPEDESAFSSSLSTISTVQTISRAAAAEELRSMEEDTVETGVPEGESAVSVLQTVSPAAVTEPEEPVPRMKKLNYTWKKELPEKHKLITCLDIPYVKNRRLISQPSALNCFLALFSEDAIQLMVTMTNKNYYIKEKQRSAKRMSSKRNADRQRRYSSPSSHTCVWSDVTIEEMKAFIGLVISMGLLRLPELSMYWRSTCPHLRTVGFGEVMSRDRFLAIYRHLHFSEPKEASPAMPDETVDLLDPPKDQLGKIRQFSEIIRKNCEQQYVPGKNVTVDESMIPFKGRVSYRHIRPAKPTRYGIKIWVLAESTTCYVSNFQLYVGKESQIISSDRYVLSGAVVMKLMEPFLNEGRHVYMDNYYTSPALLDELHKCETYACGTVRHTRKGFPKELVLTTTGRNRCERGYMDWRISGKILCCSWFDDRPVYLMSTIHPPPADENDPAIKLAVKRQMSTRKSTDIAYPPPIKDYNQYMGGVDGNDQYRKYYNVARKSRVWYRKVFGYLLEVCVHNARVMLENIEEKKYHAVRFREILTKELIGSQQTFRETKNTKPAPSTELRHDKSLWHLPTLGSEGYSLTCRYCSERASAAKQFGEKLKVNKTVIYCTACNVPLCCNRSRECFRLYHEN